jgi:hypothetical protein
METIASITTVSHVIQLAVAPVFLLSGIGAILAVLINRLGRIIDRYRVLEHGSAGTGAGGETVAQIEMAILSRRARLIHWAISLCTIGALCICIVVATLFIGSMLHVGVSQLIALMFVCAMLALIAGLLSFLREITLATGSIHVRKP